MTFLTVALSDHGGDPILAPVGIATPQRSVTGLRVAGGCVTSVLCDTELGLTSLVIAPEADLVELRYDIEERRAGCGYPEAAFAPRDTVHTRAASELAEASREIAAGAGGGRAGIEALVAEAEARFDYGHPEARFTDGANSVPYLFCGLTEGSCVDINTYLVASLRAAGYEAAYIYGYFFPKERGGITDDGHCWVVTRHAGEVLEWDIAHHLKAALGPTRPGLNPRPGERVAMTHSMGHRYAHSGREIDLKILGEPVRLPAGQAPTYGVIEARLINSTTPKTTKTEVLA